MLGAKWKNLRDEKLTAQKYRFLIGGLSPQFNPPREESQGSFFNTVHRGILPLANVGNPLLFFKVGRVVIQLGIPLLRR